MTLTARAGALVRPGRSAANPERLFVREKMLPGPLRVCRILPVHLIEASERVPEVWEIEPAFRVVVREVTRPRPVRSHVDDGKGLVRKRVDIGTCPRSGGGHVRERQRVDHGHHEAMND